MKNHELATKNMIQNLCLKSTTQYDTIGLQKALCSVKYLCSYSRSHTNVSHYYHRRTSFDTMLREVGVIHFLSSVSQPYKLLSFFWLPSYPSNNILWKLWKIMILAEKWVTTKKHYYYLILEGVHELLKPFPNVCFVHTSAVTKMNKKWTISERF